MGKYNLYRTLAKTGDFILFHGDKIIHKAIQKFDTVNGVKAYYNHTGVVTIMDGRVLIIEATGRGVRPDYLSLCMRRYTDFMVLRPKVSQSAISTGIDIAMEKAEDFIGYDFKQISAIGVYRKSNGKINLIKKNDKRDICSEWLQYVSIKIGINCYREEVIKQPFITPQDFIRFFDEREIEKINPT